MKSYDPQMHSAEHILNQTMVRMFGCERSFSSHIEKKKSKCDYRFDRQLTTEEEEELILKINHIIRQGFEVNETFIPYSKAEKDFNLSRLPDDSGDQVRIVTIGDYDACPCIGPHVKNTLEIGIFQLISTSWEEGILRIRFKIERPS
jgi:misacylated tRNA(Ala) deacylase